MQPHVRARFGCLLAALVVITCYATDSSAQNTASPAEDPQKRPCATPEYRQFDFWLGDWDVVTPDGAEAGRNRITTLFGGCVVHEQWTGAKGLAGASFNIFDAATRQWHQTWVDGSGTLLVLRGGLSADGAMVLHGERPGPDGTVRHRITWTRTDENGVRQHWEVSRDGGTWRTAFDGLYRRRAR